MIRRESGITSGILFAPIRLLTNEIAVVANELTITKKSIEILLTTFAAASSHSPKCSIATKNKNQGAMQKNERTIVQTEIFKRWSDNPKSKLARNLYRFLSIRYHIYRIKNNNPTSSASDDPIAAPLIPNFGKPVFPNISK